MTLTISPIVQLTLSPQYSSLEISSLLLFIWYSWCYPSFYVDCSDCSPSSMIFYVRLCKKWPIHSTVYIHICHSVLICTEIVYGGLLKALYMYITMTSVCMLLVLSFARSCMNNINFVSHETFDWKPCCRSSNILCFSLKCSIIYLAMLFHYFTKDTY